MIGVPKQRFMPDLDHVLYLNISMEDRDVLSSPSASVRTKTSYSRSQYFLVRISIEPHLQK